MLLVDLGFPRVCGSCLDETVTSEYCTNAFAEDLLGLTEAVVDLVSRSP